MIDENVVRAGLESLSVAIASIMEAAIDVAARQPASRAGNPDNAVIFERAGADVAQLAAAIAVLINRSNKLS